MIFFCILSLIVMVSWAIFDDESGCLKVALFYAALILFLMAVFSLRRCYQSPEFNNEATVKTNHGTIVHWFSHTQYRCPNGVTYYCVEKNDSISPTRNDICVNCGSFFREHDYEKSSEEEALDEQFWQRILESTE